MLGEVKFQANCKTTAMGIMPHRDVEEALKLALSLDIPFWPQLPKISFYEDMYAQTSQNFPGIVLDIPQQRITFNSQRFAEELEAYSQQMDNPHFFALTPEYSAVYHRFLEADLEGCPAIRGQLTGPVSFGFRVVDENSKPIIYNESVRTILYDFIQRKANAHLRQLRAKNKNAFLWLDEPGLGWVFSGMTGYNDIQAKEDYAAFLLGIEEPRALHLCANVNLPYLLSLGIDLLSFDAYQLEHMPRGYAADIASFLEKGGVISWGIVPTDSDNLAKETPHTLAEKLSGYWEVVANNTNITPRHIARQALIAPARCCLKNIGSVGACDDVVGSSPKGVLTQIEERLVEKAFAYLPELSHILRMKYSLE